MEVKAMVSLVGKKKNLEKGFEQDLMEYSVNDLVMDLMVKLVKDLVRDLLNKQTLVKLNPILMGRLLVFVLLGGELVKMMIVNQTVVVKLLTILVGLVKRCKEREERSGVVRNERGL